MIFFSDAREIFYAFRERQVEVLHNFLVQQQRLGILRADANIRNLAERVILSLGALFVEWADRPFAFELLEERLYGTYENLMSDVVTPSIDRLRLSLRRSEEHTSELQSLMRISYAVFCLKKKTPKNNNKHEIITIKNQ